MPATDISHEQLICTDAGTDSIPFFFIVGRPRSGTTLLRTLFDAHPNVAIPLECKFALDLFPRYGKIRHWTQKDIDDFYSDLREQLLFDTWTLDLQELKAGLDACTGPTPYSRICRTVYLHYRSFFPKQKILLIGDKNPGYTIYTRQLSRLFPGAKFIHIVRDYRDNYLSTKNVHFELPIPALVAAKWRLFYRKFNRDALHDPDNYCVVRYEDLVGDPRGQVEELCRFLGVPFNEGVFDFNEKKEEVMKSYPEGFVERYHANLMNKVNASRMGLWKEKLSGGEVRLLDFAAGGAADEAGYVRRHSSFSLTLKLKALPGIGLAHFLAFLTRIVDRLPYRMRINILNKWPLAIALFYSRFIKRKTRT